MLCTSCWQTFTRRRTRQSYRNSSCSLKRVARLTTKGDGLLLGSSEVLVHYNTSVVSNFLLLEISMKHFSVIYKKDGSLVVTIFDANSMTVQLKMVAQIA